MSPRGAGRAHRASILGRVHADARRARRLPARIRAARNLAAPGRDHRSAAGDRGLSRGIGAGHENPWDDPGTPEESKPEVK